MIDDVVLTQDMLDNPKMYALIREFDLSYPYLRQVVIYRYLDKNGDHAYPLSIYSP